MYHTSVSLRRLALLAALMAGLGPLANQAMAGEPALLIRDAMVFDGTGRDAFPANVLVRDGVIAAVEPGLAPPKGATVINASGQTLLPGLFDLHTHWTPNAQPSELPLVANRYLAAGVTTVSDFHQPPEAYAPRRQWLQQIVAPQVKFAARISTPLGHGADWGDENTTRWVNSPEAARAGVRAVAAYRPDFIKAFADGWRYSNAADNSSMDESTLTALVDEAHKHGLKVFTHTVMVKRGKSAARAGVDVIAHSLQDGPVDAELVELMRTHGTAYAPSLAVYLPERVDGSGKGGNPAVLAQRDRNFANALANVKTLHDAGVPVVLGTDAGMTGTPHGTAALAELELFVRAGMTPSEALLSGTSRSARAFGLDDRGTIEVGKRADLLLVKGQPWRNIGDIRNTERVFVGGTQVHGKGVSLPAANQRTALPAQPVPALVDDFERADERTALDTLRLDEADGGNDRTLQISGVVARDTGGQALLVQSKMSHKESPYAAVLLPLSRGSVAPVQVSGYTGLRFEIRGGAGDVRAEVRALDNRRFAAPIPVTRQWQVVEVPFAQLQGLPPYRAQGPLPQWQGDDLVQLGFSISGEPGSKVWFEIDNVGFY